MNKCVRALLCLYLTLIIAMDAVKAQTLKVGDTLPPELWSMPLQVVNHPTGKETLTLSEYRDKLIILDFWATWCAPCIKSLTKLDTLQREFGEQLAVVPITYEAADKVLPFLTKRGYQLLSVINDSTLKKYFPHRSIPHQVWVRAGEVLAVTGAEYATRENISKTLNEEKVQMLMKEEDMEFDAEGYLISSSDEWCVSGIKKRANVKIGGMRASKYGLVYYNSTAEYMFRDVFRRNYPFLIAQNRILYDTPDSLSSQLRKPSISQNGNVEEDLIYQKWLQNNSYVYYLRFSEPQHRRTLYLKMHEDITSYFKVSKNIEVHIEERMVPCYVLKRITPIPSSANSTPVYTLDNRPFKYFYEDLLVYTDQQPYPIVDETGFTGNHTIKLNTSLDNIAALKKELPTFGIELVLETREIEMLVFKQITN